MAQNNADSAIAAPPPDESTKGAAAQQKLGTFLGVYTPTVLTILGVIMYLRLGWVVGQVGLESSLLMIALANVITLVTTLSFSSVATNVRVGVGGAYNIISRSLGLELGGAIGLPLFLAQTLSVTLYAFGLAEAVAFVWPAVPIQETAAVIIVLVGALALKGAHYALRVQIPLMVAIGISILALVIGALTGEPIDVSVGVEPVAGGEGFWIVFAVFFPAVTGIMAGLGLSGDLKDPAKSLPRGSITAVLTGFVVYMALPFVLVWAATPEALRTDELIWTTVAPLGAILILPGLCGAIFSSAVGSILGAPRTLQALALDALAPRWLGATSRRSDEPLVGVIVTTLLALGAVLLGDLNTVAEVVSMFFLTVYGMVNLVAALETLAGDPSWRPKIALPWILPLAGGLACLAVMFLISPVASLVAITFETLLWGALRRRERLAELGDVRRGAYEQLIRWSLVRLARRPMTARNWRPHVLVFADDIERRIDLVRFGTWFAAGRGVVTVCELVVGDVMDEAPQLQERRERTERVLAAAKLVAFPEVDIVADVVPGMVSVSQANGIAGLDSNTILVGFPNSIERLSEFLGVLRRLECLHRSMVLGRVRSERTGTSRKEQEIHVWWGGRQANGDLMLLLAYLLTRSAEWRRARIHLLTIPAEGESDDEALRALEELIAEVRIPAEPGVVSREPGASIAKVIQARSVDADVVFLGLNVPAADEVAQYAERILELIEPLPTVFLVRNSTLFRGELV